jgi:hypothetical protein
MKLNMSVDYFIYTGGMQVVRKNVTHVRFDPSVVHIPRRAFQDCSALVKVEFHDGLQTIGAQAFKNCTALNDIDLPNGLRRIGAMAFGHCRSLLRIIIPPTVIAIEKDAFTYCTALVEVVFHEGLQRIERNAFAHCALLLCVTIPTTIISIGACAFACELLRNVAISPSTSALVTQDVFANSFLYLHYKGISLEMIKGRCNDQSLDGICYNYNPMYGDPQVDAFIHKVGRFPLQELEDQDCLGMTPLHILLCSGRDCDVRVIKFIVEKCPHTLLTKDRWGEVPLVYALLGNSSLEVINFILEMHSKRWQSLPFDFGELLIRMLNRRRRFGTQFMRDIIRLQGIHFADHFVDWPQIFDKCINGLCRLATIDTFRVLVEASISTRRYNCMSNEHRIEVDIRICEIENDDDYIQYVYHVDLLSHQRLRSLLYLHTTYHYSNDQRVLQYYAGIHDMVTRFVQLQHELLQKTGNTLVRVMPADAVKNVLSFM